MDDLTIPSLLRYDNTMSGFLQDYIAVKEKYAKYLPHSSGRYQVKRFRKAQCPIVERLTCSLMMHGRNNGKKLMAMRIVKHAFEIIHLLTGEVRHPCHCSISIAFQFSPFLQKHRCRCSFWIEHIKMCEKPTSVVVGEWRRKGRPCVVVRIPGLLQ